MPLVFIFVAALFWLTILTLFAIGWLLRTMFHMFAVPVYGARGRIYGHRAVPAGSRGFSGPGRRSR
jgi:hypothetical protein